MRRHLFALGYRFRVHDPRLPGRPDVVFSSARVAVFVDGDFWHGWRFPAWAHKLAPYWREKISRNRARDAMNFRRLRRHGWIVVRVWEHEVTRDLEKCIRRIVDAVGRRD